MKETYIFDSNFFIFLENTEIPNAFSMIKNTAMEGNLQFSITNFILDEIRTLRNYDEILKGFENKEITQTDIDEFKGKTNIKNLPQDPDLSLVVYSELLSKQGKDVVIVSDDYKLYEMVNNSHLPFKVISPSAFLLTMFHRTRDKEIKRLYKKVRNYEMNYMLERSNIYPVNMKLSWLMDNLVLSAENSKIREVFVEKEEHELHSEDVLRYIRGERVKPSKLKEFKSLLPYFEVLKKSHDVQEKAKEMANKGDVKNALLEVRGYLSQLKEELQRDSAEVGHDGEIKLRYVYSFELSKLHLLGALLNVSLSDHHAVEERLDDVAFTSLICRNFEGIVTAYIYRGMLELLDKDYVHAEKFFGLAMNLSIRYDLPWLYVKTVMGLSVSQFFNGEKEESVETINLATDKIVYHETEMAPVLYDFGNQLYYFGLTYLAYGVYIEALECSIEGKLDELKDEIKERIKKCIKRLYDNVPERDEGISKLISFANHIRDDSDKEIFDKEFSELIKKS